MFRASSFIDRVKELLPALPVLAFLGYFFGLPVFNILVQAIYSPEVGFGLQQIRKLADNSVYIKVLSTTFLISFLTTLLSVVLVYPVAYFLSQLNVQSRSRWIVWLLVPFWTSYLVKTFAWILILSRTGVIGSLCVALGFSRDVVSLLPSLSAVLVSMVHGMLPLAAMTMLPIMQGISKQLSKAAQTLGADRITSFFTVFLPLSAVGVAGALLLVFITSLGFFITPALLGTPYETMVAQLVITAVCELLNLPAAGALSLPLLFSAILIFVAYDRLVGLSSLSSDEGKRSLSSFSSSLRAVCFFFGRMLSQLFDRLRRGGVQLSAGSGLKAYSVAVFALLLLPIAMVLPIAFTSSPFLAFPPIGFSFKWFEAYLFSPIWQAATLRSLMVATATAVLALFLGVSATLSMARLPNQWSKSLFAFLIAPLIVPRIVIALGLFYLYGRLALAGTDVGLIIGHTVLAIPYVIITMSAAIKRFDWQLDNVARILGASAWQRLYTIILPLLLPALIASFLFAFVTSFDDLTIVIFVSGGLKTTLPKQMWDDIQLQVSPIVAAISSILVVAVSLFLLLPVFLKKTTKSKGEYIENA